MKFTALLIFPFLFLTACEKDEDVKLAKAQQCFDAATISTVSECLNHLEGLESPESYSIRCGIRYMSEGFTNQRFVNAFKDLKASNGNDQMAIAMAYLTVDRNVDAQAIYSDCSKSSSASLKSFAGMTVAATSITTFAGAGVTIGADGLTVPADIDGAITNFRNNATNTEKEAIGNLAIDMHSTFCANGSGYSSTDICTNLNAAVTGGNALAVANALLAALNR